jgi:hypothetical protein
MGALIRGLRNLGRNLARSVLVVLLLSVIIGIFGIMIQAASLTRQQLSQLEARVRTLIELREAGAFGTGGFGGDKPIGEEAFSIDTLERVKAIPHARHLVRVDEYVYTPQIDPSKPNAYAMVIGLHPGAELRAIGEVDYEHARIIAGRDLRAGDGDQPVAVIGRLYALQRAHLQPPWMTARWPTPASSSTARRFGWWGSTPPAMTSAITTSSSPWRCSDTSFSRGRSSPRSSSPSTRCSASRPWSRT